MEGTIDAIAPAPGVVTVVAIVDVVAVVAVVAVSDVTGGAEPEKKRSATRAIAASTTMAMAAR